VFRQLPQCIYYLTLSNCQKRRLPFWTTAEKGHSAALPRQHRLVPQSHQMMAYRRSCLTITRRFFSSIASLPLRQSF
jgi:hypothetical protein